MAKDPPSSDLRPVFFFDIDNCLYPRSKRVHDLMHDLINKYFETHLSLTRSEAHALHQKYYRDHGLAIEGLVRYHKVDPLAYNEQVDDAVPLDGLLTPDLHLRRLLQAFDKRKVKLWLFTNAHVTHGERVCRLLGVRDCFEGITYCDYAEAGRTGKLVCKPHKKMFEKAEREAGAAGIEQCYFVDDSYLNCSAAQKRGWTAVHILEADDPEPLAKASGYQIRSLSELRGLFPQFFRRDAATWEELEVEGLTRIPSASERL